MKEKNTAGKSSFGYGMMESCKNIRGVGVHSGQREKANAFLLPAIAEILLASSKLSSVNVGLVFVLKSLSCIISTTKMALARTFYNTLVKKNSVFITTIFASAFAFEVAFDTTTSRVWDNLNKGVSARLFSFLCFLYINVCMQQVDGSISRHISISNGIILVILGRHLISTTHILSSTTTFNYLLLME